MPKNNFFVKSLSFILLFGILSILAPKEILSGHDHHVKICHDQNLHFDQAEHECSLCDVTIPAFQLEQENNHFTFISLSKEILIRCLGNFSLQAGHQLFLRGPPSSF